MLRLQFERDGEPVGTGQRMFRRRRARRTAAARRNMSNEKLKPAPGAGEIPQPEYLNKAQIAARLGVSRRTVDNLVAARKLPHVKFSARLVRFPRAAVDDYLARNLTVAARGQEGGDSHV